MNKYDTRFQYDPARRVQMVDLPVGPPVNMTYDTGTHSIPVVVTPLPEATKLHDAPGLIKATYDHGPLADRPFIVEDKPG
jgi:hypothetical protein